MRWHVLDIGAGRHPPTEHGIHLRARQPFGRHQDRALRSAHGCPSRFDQIDHGRDALGHIRLLRKKPDRGIRSGSCIALTEDPQTKGASPHPIGVRKRRDPPAVEVFADERQVAGPETQAQLCDESPRHRSDQRARTPHAQAASEQHAHRRIRDRGAARIEVAGSGAFPSAGADAARYGAAPDHHIGVGSGRLRAAERGLPDAGRGIRVPVPQPCARVILSVDEFAVGAIPAGFEIGVILPPLSSSAARAVDQGGGHHQRPERREAECVERPGDEPQHHTCRNRNHRSDEGQRRAAQRRWRGGKSYRRRVHADHSTR